MCLCREESNCSFSTAALSRAGRSSQRTRGSDCRLARPCELPPDHRVAASGSSRVTSRACPDHRRDRQPSRRSSLSLKQIAGRRPDPPVSAGKIYQGLFPRRSSGALRAHVSYTSPCHDDSANVAAKKIQPAERRGTEMGSAFQQEDRSLSAEQRPC
jgi:hypothetical protein